VGASSRRARYRVVEVRRVVSGFCDWPGRYGHPRPFRSTTVWPVIAVLLVLAVGGCGGGAGRSSSSSLSSVATSSSVTTSASVVLPAVCAPAARAMIGRAFGMPVGERRGESAQATPQCVFRRGSRLRVTVLLDGFAQPYQRLERTQIEDAQQFGTSRLEALPTPIGHLGIDAYWFPTERKVMTTDGRRLVSVFVVGSGVPAPRVRTLAIAVARGYLGASDPTAADPNGS